MASTITGFTKVFYSNYMFGVNLDSATVTSGNFALAYDNNPNTDWNSVGSDDTTTETVTITFDSAQTIDRIMILNENWKDFDIMYDSGGWTNFTNVYSEKDDSPVTGIIYTANTNATRYFEFDSVSTTMIRIRVTKTFVVDDQKSLAELYIGQELGTFLADIFCRPNKTTIKFDSGEKTITLSNQASRQILKGRKVAAKVKLGGIFETDDQTLVSNMFSQREVSILFNGAYDVYTHEAFRLKDLYTCIIKGDYMSNHAIGRDKTVGYDYKFDLLEI